jgi:hypothetical protein
MSIRFLPVTFAGFVLSTLEVVKLRIFARGIQDDAPSNLPTGQWGGANYPGAVNVGINAPGKNVVANLTWTISPKMVNEVEFCLLAGNHQQCPLWPRKLAQRSFLADQ